MSGAQYEELFALLISVCYKEVFVGRGWDPLLTEIIRTFDLFVDSLLSISIEFSYRFSLILQTEYFIKIYCIQMAIFSNRKRTSR